MVAATLALLAFILAFTFGMAGSWFDTRRRLVVDEANAIGTTYLRAAFLPEPQRSGIRDLLREYVDVRLEAARPGRLVPSLRRSEAIHARLWDHATAVAEKHPESVVVGLFIWSLNEMIDLHSVRLALGPRTRLPETIWATLYFVAFLGMAVIGYHAGLAGSGRSMAILALALAFPAVLTLIADIDRPQEGLLRISPQPLLDLQRSLRDAAGGSASVPPAALPGRLPLGQIAPPHFQSVLQQYSPRTASDGPPGRVARSGRGWGPRSRRRPGAGIVTGAAVTEHRSHRP
jgi:hypothetical protein